MHIDVNSCTFVMERMRSVFSEKHLGKSIEINIYTSSIMDNYTAVKNTGIMADQIGRASCMERV